MYIQFTTRSHAELTIHFIYGTMSRLHEFVRIQTNDLYITEDQREKQLDASNILLTCFQHERNNIYYEVILIEQSR